MEQNDVQSNFWVGQTLEIYSDKKDAYFTEIKKLNDQWIIDWPINSKGLPLRISTKESITVYFYDKLQDQLYYFESSIEANRNKEVFLQAPEEEKIKKAQRRRFFRVETGVKLHLNLLVDKEKNKYDIVELYTKDISGGGLSFLNPVQLVNSDDQITGTLFLKNGIQQDEIKFKGRVVDSYLTPRNSYKTAVEFLEMNESTRSEIIKFCMYKQIEHRKLLNDIKYK